MKLVLERPIATLVEGLNVVVVFVCVQTQMLKDG